MFQNLTIKARLIFIMCFMSALLLGGAAIGLYGISQNGDGIKSVYEDRTVPLSLTAHIESKLLENRLAIAVALVTPTPEVIANSAATIEKNIAEITKTWEAYMAAYHTPEEKKLADKFAEVRFPVNAGRAAFL